MAIGAVAFAAASWGHGRLVYLTLNRHGADASALTRTLGKVVHRSKDGQTITVELKNGVTEADAVRFLLAKPTVATAWSDSIRKIDPDRDLRSLSATHKLIVKLQGGVRHDRELKVKGEQEVENGADYLRGWERYVHDRAYPYDKVDWNRWANARAFANKLPAYRPSATAATSAAPSNGLSTMAVGLTTPTWQFFGPQNLDVPYVTYYGRRPTSGRVNALAIDPTNANTYYLGAASGGIWKSTDAGVNWTALTDNWDFLQTSSIAIDPSNHNNVYVGTGDFHGFAGYQMGLMKSTNGGTTWTNYGKAQFGTAAVSKVLIDPDFPTHILVTTGRGSSLLGYVWMSTNGGVTWTKALPTSDIWSGAAFGAKDVNGVRTFWVVSGLDGLVYKSTDHFQTWTAVTTPAKADVENNLDIACSPNIVGNVYILDNNQGKIYKSVDNGANWTDMSANFPGGYNWSQAFYDYHIDVAQGATNDNVYVGLIDIVHSTDGGVNWSSLGLTYTGSAITHNDQHCWAVNPQDANDVIWGCDGGVYHYKNGVITGLSKTLGITQFYNATFHPSDTTRVIGGTQDNASPAAMGDLANWNNRGGGDGGFTAINPANPLVQYCTVYDATVIQTQDGWQTQRDISPPLLGGDNLPFTTYVYQDPYYTDYLYATTNYLYVYSLTHDAWYYILAPTFSGAFTDNDLITAIAVSKMNPNVMYVGTGDGRIWMTQSKLTGSGWVEITRGTPSLYNQPIKQISVDPTNPYDILIAVGGGGGNSLYRCHTTLRPPYIYQNLSAGLPNIPANCVERDPANPSSAWFVGNDIGVFSTQNQGASWANMTQPLGLPNVQVNTLQYVPLTGYLNAATFGRGVWRIRLSGAVSTVLLPQDITIVNGTRLSGTLASIQSSDGQFYFLQSLLKTGTQKTIFTSTFKAPASVVVYNIKLDFRGLQPKGSTLGLSLYDWNQNAYVPVTTVSMNGSSQLQSLNVPNTGAYVASDGTIKVQLTGTTGVAKPAFATLIDCLSMTVR